MTTLTAFNQKRKDEVLAQLHEHARLGQIVKGQYWVESDGVFCGCLAGCLTHDPDGGHSLFPDMFGIPEWFAHLIDAVFEGLPADDAMGWPVRVIAAIPAGFVWTDAVWQRLNADRLEVEVLREGSESFDLVNAVIEALRSGDMRAIDRAAGDAGAAQAAWDAARAGFWQREADRITGLWTPNKDATD